VDATGTKKFFAAYTLENRGLDVGGYDVTVDGNDITVYRHQQGDAPTYFSTDGEGILNQAAATAQVNGMTITNNTVGSFIAMYKVFEMRNVLIENNNCYYNGAQNGMVYCRSDANAGPNPMYNVIIRNNSVTNGIDWRASQYSSGYDGNEITGNTGTGTIAYCSPNVNVHDNPGLTLGTPIVSTQVNRGPEVAITSPVMYANTTSNVTITASASDTDGTVAKVEFYTQGTTGVGMVLLGTDSDGSNGWSLNCTGLTYGADYMIAAKAYDDLNKAWASYPVYFQARLDGDANLDRYADVIDLGLLATNYGKGIGAKWGEGDFNGDGKVDVIDLGLLATKYGQGPAAVGDVVPEPATMSLIGIGLAGLLRRRN
jgi:hypothetical protein